MMTGRLALAIWIFVLSVVMLLLLSRVMIDLLPFLRIEGVITIMGILATILFKIPDLINWLNTQPSLQKDSQVASTPNPGMQAEPASTLPGVLAASQGSLPVLPPTLQEWDSIAATDHTSLILTHDNKLVDIEFNPHRLRVMNHPLKHLMQDIDAIIKGPFDPSAAPGIGNQLFDLMFPSYKTVQINTERGDLFVYYPYSPDELGTIPYELIRKWGSDWGVLRLPGGNPKDAHAVMLRRVLSAFHAPARFRLLIVVYIDKNWEDVDQVLNEWLLRLPEEIEPEVYLDKRATPSRVRNLIAGGGYDAIYFIAHHQSGKLELHEGELDLRDLTVKDNPLIFLNACEAANIDSKAVRVLLEGGAGYVIGTLNKVDAVEAIKFGGLFFEALFGCYTYHNYLNSKEHFGLHPPGRPLPVARAVSWARKGFEKRSGIGWSYVLFGQPEARKLEELIQDMATLFRQYGRWKDFVDVLDCILPEEEIRALVRQESTRSLAGEDWDTIEQMLELPSPYLEDLHEKVDGWVKEKFVKREWQLVINCTKVLETLGIDAAERAEKAARADQLVMEVREDLKR